MGIDILTREAQSLSEKQIELLVELIRQMKKEKEEEDKDGTVRKTNRKAEAFGMYPDIVIHEGFDDIPEGFEDYI